MNSGDSPRLPPSTLSQTGAMKRMDELEKRLKQADQQIQEQRRFQMETEQILRQIVKEDDFRKGVSLLFTEFDGKLADAFSEFGKKTHNIFWGGERTFPPPPRSLKFVNFGRSFVEGTSYMD